MLSLPKEGREYKTFNYPASGTTLVTGIRQVEDSQKVYISANYRDECKQNNGAVYKGDLNGKGKWYIINFPGKDVTGSSWYGPNSVGKDIQLVGNYTVKDSKNTIPCLYQGNLKGEGKFTTLEPFDAKSGIAHSTMGNLVVGNYTTYKSYIKIKLTEKIANAFIYDIETKKYYKLKLPGAESITAYGIWHNGKDSYTICGGYFREDKEQGYIVNLDKKHWKLSNFTSYSFDKHSAITHFNGITSDGKCGYYLVGDAVNQDGPLAFFAHVKKVGKEANWRVVSYPKSENTSANSVYETTVIGIYTDKHNKINSYISQTLLTC